MEQQQQKNRNRFIDKVDKLVVARGEWGMGEIVGGGIGEIGE